MPDIVVSLDDGREQRLNEAARIIFRGLDEDHPQRELHVVATHEGLVLDAVDASPDGEVVGTRSATAAELYGELTGWGAKRDWWLHLVGLGEGCDHTIACNQRLVVGDRPMTPDQARRWAAKEARRRGEMRSVTLASVQEVVELDADMLTNEVRELRRRRKLREARDKLRDQLRRVEASLSGKAPPKPKAKAKGRPEQPDEWWTVAIQGDWPAQFDKLLEQVFTEAVDGLRAECKMTAARYRELRETRPDLPDITTLPDFLTFVRDGRQVGVHVDRQSHFHIGWVKIRLLRPEQPWSLR